MKALFIIFHREMLFHTQYYSFWKPDQPAGHAELVLDYSPVESNMCDSFLRPFRKPNMFCVTSHVDNFIPV